MSAARSGGWVVLALGALAGAGYASVQGMLPALPYGFDKTLKQWTLVAAEKTGIPLTPKSPAPAGVANASVPAAPPPRPPVSVRVAPAEKKTMPIRFEAIGTVQTVASVAVRARVDSQITAVEFSDGASIKAGQILFRLDPRQIEAQIKQAEGTLARSKATLELNEQDVRRKEQLARNESTSQALLDAARANVATARAQIRADEAALENLKVQRTFYDISAPISGRIGVATLKLGNIVRAGEAAQVLATINQIMPIYVAFPVPQRMLPELREAVAAGTATVSATSQGMSKSATGKIALLDNAVDATTGTIIARAIFENQDELLWPGSLANVRVDLREVPNSVVVPRESIMNGQQGAYVFIIEGDTARVRPVTIDRTIEGSTVILKGLDGSETVVTDGQMLLTNNAKVALPRPAGTGNPPAAAPAARSAPPARGTQG